MLQLAPGLPAVRARVPLRWRVLPAQVVLAPTVGEEQSRRLRQADRYPWRRLLCFRTRRGRVTSRSLLVAFFKLRLESADR